MLKIDFYTKKEDFALNYFSKIYWDEKNAIDNNQLENLALSFNIDKSKIKNIKNIDKKIRENLFIRYDAKENQKDLISLEKYFSPINETLMKKIINNLNLYIEKYINILKDLFGETIIENIEISFIDSPLVNFYHGLTYRFLPNKIFLFIKNNKSDLEQEEILAYTKTILHEFTHLFLFKNEKFQNIMKREWENKYKDITPNNFRNNIEEIIVNNIINGNRDYGYLYNDLNIKNDNEKESEILLSNKFKRSTYDFLDKLKNGNSLENELPIFIEKITVLAYLNKN